MTDVYILGINAYHADASAVLLKNGSVVAALEEERFNRIKHSAGFPKLAIRYCLEQAGISISDVAHIGVSRVPSAHLINKITFVLFNRLMFTRQGLDRLRSVEKNPRFWNLIEAFRRRTGIPLLLNTSFNENEPIVCTPQDALHCFSTTRMDALVLGDYLVSR